MREEHRMIWRRIRPGEYDCLTASIYRNILGSWCVRAKMGFRLKDGVCSYHGLRTLAEAKSKVREPTRRELIAKIEHLQKHTSAT